VVFRLLHALRSTLRFYHKFCFHYAKKHVSGSRSRDCKDYLSVVRTCYIL
jgi:hypothetical protein